MKTAMTGGFLLQPACNIILGYNRLVRNSILLLFISLLMTLTGCDATVAGESATSTPNFVTAVLPPSPVPLPTQTLPPPTPAPTIQPIDGTTTTQVNVRVETSTASESLGTIPQFSKVQIIGRDSSTSWYQIIYADSPTGTGWLRAEYVRGDAAAEIPVVASEAGGGSGVSGLVIQKINVRRGPGTSFELLGELNPKDVVFIFGKDESGEWAQIEFSGSANGNGWVALKFLQMENAEALIVIENATTTPQAAAGESAPSVDALSSAVQDGDSMQAPSAAIIFSANGARSAQINGDISSPDGDAEDWVQLTSQNGQVLIQLLCSEGMLKVELWNNGKVVESFSLACAENRLLNIKADETYLLRLSEADTNVFRHTKYALILDAIQ